MKRYLIILMALELSIGLQAAVDKDSVRSKIASIDLCMDSLEKAKKEVDNLRLTKVEREDTLKSIAEKIAKFKAERDNLQNSLEEEDEADEPMEQGEEEDVPFEAGVVALNVPVIIMCTVGFIVLSIIIFMVMYIICVKGARLFLPSTDELQGRVNMLEDTLHKQADYMNRMEREIAGLRTQLQSQPQSHSVGGLGINGGARMAQTIQPQQPQRPQQQTLFFSVPTGENALGQASNCREIGKSVYQLTTTDGVNGTFVVIQDADAIATALLSLSQVLKPVCRVNPNRGGIPRNIRTLEEGMAVREGNVWRVVRKALIELQD